MTFVERIGGVLTRPRPTLADAACGPSHGVRDVAILLALRVCAGETIDLARAAFALPSLGAVAGLRGLLHAVLAIAPDVLGILVGSIVMGLFAGKAAVRGRELAGALPPACSRSSVGYDVAVYAWVPYLAVTLAAALIFAALRRPPGSLLDGAVAAVAVGWSAVVWALGLAELRRAPSEGAPA